MAERILVPLDGTQFGEAILPKLEELVLKSNPGTDTEITLLKVISMMNYNVLTEDEAAQLRVEGKELDLLKAEARTYLEQVAAQLRRKGIKVKIAVSLGNTAREIVKSAQDIKANLIAMSTHGRSGLSRWALGSVTDRVMCLESNIPVLAVKTVNSKSHGSVLPLESLQSLLRYI